MYEDRISNPVIPEADSAFASQQRTIYSIGHSTLEAEDFLELLKANRIQLLVDVRRFPKSERVPWTTRNSLATRLSESGIRYEHVEELGGYRTARSDSRNTGWRNTGFRGYADYMETREFEAGLSRLIALANGWRTVYMCAEAVPWKCHRSLLSDALVVRGFRIVHILGPGKRDEHRLTTFAKVHDKRLAYPPLPGKGLKPSRPSSPRKHGSRRPR